MSTVFRTCGIKSDNKKSLGEYIQTSTTPEKQHNNAVIMNMHNCWAAISIWQGAIDKHLSPRQVLRYAMSSRQTWPCPTARRYTPCTELTLVDRMPWRSVQ